DQQRDAGCVAARSVPDETECEKCRDPDDCRAPSAKVGRSQPPVLLGERREADAEDRSFVLGDPVPDGFGPGAVGRPETRPRAVACFEPVGKRNDSLVGLYRGLEQEGGRRGRSIGKGPYEVEVAVEGAFLVQVVTSSPARGF